MNEIVLEMEYLRVREQKLRDTNESTNERVKWFAFGDDGHVGWLGRLAGRVFEGVLQVSASDLLVAGEVVSERLLTG